MPNRTIGLAGNPNCGKTTLFNRLTGARQVTGNWPGVTVERKEGQVKGKPWTLVDLPGTYSLISYSPEEKVAASFLRDTPPDLVLNIVDATALERNLFLTLQLLEQNLPTVVAVNLCDQLAKNGGRVDCKVLSQRLGVPVIPISARSGENIGKLVKALEKAEKRPGVGPALFALNADQSQEDRYEMIRLLLDGVYDSDPKKNPDAKKFDEISYLEVISRGLQAMDTTAVTLCMENNIPILAFGLSEKESIKRAVLGEKMGTLIR